MLSSVFVPPVVFLSTQFHFHFLFLTSLQHAFLRLCSPSRLPSYKCAVFPFHFLFLISLLRACLRLCPSCRLPSYSTLFPVPHIISTCVPLSLSTRSSSLLQSSLYFLFLTPLPRSFRLQLTIPTSLSCYEFVVVNNCCHLCIVSGVLLRFVSEI